jgi:nicotinamidase-related amidase
MNTALLVIDVQTALCAGRWAMAGIEPVIERINATGARARAAQWPVVWVQHEAADSPLEHGSPGWQLDPRLDVAAGDLRVRKTASDSFHRTDLHALLQARGVGRLMVCGLQSEFCVDSTVRGALAHGYAVELIGDAHTTMDNGVLSAAQISAHHNTTLANVDSYGPRVTVTPAAQLRFA